MRGCLSTPGLPTVPVGAALPSLLPAYLLPCSESCCEEALLRPPLRQWVYCAVPLITEYLAFSFEKLSGRPFLSGAPPVTCSLFV